MEQLGIPELTTEQIEELCTTAENAARKHVPAKVPSKMVEKLNISVKANGSRPVMAVEIDISLAPQTKNFAVDRLVREAVKEALKASENYLRKPL